MASDILLPHESALSSANRFDESSLAAAEPVPATGHSWFQSSAFTTAVPLAADQPTTTILPGATVTAAIDFSGDIDLFDINLVAGQTYSFSLAGSGSFPLFDPLLTLRLGDTAVASDDDGGIGLSSLLTFTATQSGTYQISAAGYPSSPTSGPSGGYTLAVRQMGADRSAILLVMRSRSRPTLPLMASSNRPAISTSMP